MYDVITVGAAVRDVFLLSRAFMLIPLPELGGNLAECVSLGSKIDVDDLVHTTGGGATNAAATFARLGFATACITRVGDDEPGRAVIADLMQHGVDASTVKTLKNGKTAYSAVLTAMNGERTILTYRGVSAEFQEKDVRLGKLRAQWLYISSLAGNLEPLLSLARQSKLQNMHIAFNPGAGELKAGLRALDPVLRQVAILLMNIEEAQILAGIQTTDVRELARKIVRPGMTLVLTDAGNGAHAFQDGTIWRSGTRAVRAVSRTGAGDAFGSGFVAARMRGYDIADALRVATANAESVIGHIGAKAGILTSWPSKRSLAAISVTVT